MAGRQCYFAAEIADKLGMRPHNLYRDGVMERLHARGMPRSVTAGRIRIPKAAFDAWFNRDHPLRPKPPANDVEATPAPASTAEWQTFLHSSYSRSR